MRLVVSPYLEPDDCAALERAQENPAAVLRTIDARSLAEIEDARIKDRLKASAWLAAAGRLAIKLAMGSTTRAAMPEDSSTPRLASFPTTAVTTSVLRGLPRRPFVWPRLCSP
jgi:hypothetical protein